MLQFQNSTGSWVKTTCSSLNDISGNLTGDVCVSVLAVTRSTTSSVTSAGVGSGDVCTVSSELER